MTTPRRRRRHGRRARRSGATPRERRQPDQARATDGAPLGSLSCRRTCRGRGRARGRRPGAARAATLPVGILPAQPAHGADRPVVV